MLTSIARGFKRMLERFRSVRPFGLFDTKVENKIQHFNDGAMLSLLRRRPKSGALDTVDHIRMGPNRVHAFITHPDGTIKDLGVSKNLLTNIGRDWFCSTFGGFIPAGGAGSPATASGATSITATGTPWTASNLATPQLGLAGFRVYASVTGITTAPVYGNIVSNTTSVATLDQWWNATDGVGTTPASTNAFIIGAGGMASIRFMALTTNSGAAAAADTTLTGEITTGGCNRSLATYAHTMGNATFTLQKAYSVTASFTAIHKMGLFLCLTSAGADPMVLETVLNADATVANGDTLTVTDTITCSG
jgi:hypothetical protein